ncbi:A24 family peptidase [Jannaschia pohangensis]|uniref:Prepilin peptidase CpaA n=1 Tax=Jannaschia pohangensis TaxID=390807 RepID=A0A1I3LUR4_9RHOB|nr:prepilin peptidase [Jannaschia pohangensis]SFI88447.1 prepilin peptidase CpaA [Jannaschia pohangensis]
MEPLAQAALLAATPMQGVVFGLLSLPICLWAAYTDLSTMKIKNEAVLALAAVFVVAGLFVLPTFTEYLWRYAHLGVILVIGFLMSAMRMLGAGDAKFAAAMAPFVALADVIEVLLIFSALLILTYVLHRIIRMIPAIRNLAPDWKSWHEKKDFPMGVTLAATQMTYLGLAALQQ